MGIIPIEQNQKNERLKREIITYIFRKSKRMKAVFDYVHKPNNLDIDMISLQQQIKELKKSSHPPIFSKKERDDILNRLKKLESE